MLGISGLSRFARGSDRRCAASEPSRSPGAHTTLRRWSLILGVLAAACATGSEDDKAPSANTTANEDDPSSGSMRGTLVLYMSSFEDGTGDKQYFLRNGKNETRLYFATDPDLAPGTPLHVSGEPMNDGLRVENFNYEAEQGVGAAIQPLISGMTYKA